MDKNQELSRKRRGATEKVKMLHSLPRTTRYEGNAKMTKMLDVSSGRERFVPNKNCHWCENEINDSSYYYECLTCKDYQLCVSCETKNDRLIDTGQEPHHNPAHIMVKQSI